MSSAAEVVVGPGGPLRGRLRAPGDKSISHRALLVGALAKGTSVFRGLSRGDDVLRTAAAVGLLGAQLEPWPDGVPGQTELRVSGGPGCLHEPEDVLDLGNSGTATRLLAGLAAAYPWSVVLTGDGSVRRRPMDRVVAPLREMGARVDGREGGRLAPLALRGGRLRPIDYQPPVASAQVKSAIMLAALGAGGTTTVREQVATRAHTEELLALAGARVTLTREAGGPGAVVTVEPGRLEPFELDVPADPSQAAFFVVAACLVPGSEVVCERVYVGHGRAGFLDVLERMGADVELHRLDETTADIVARHRPLTATDIGGAEVPGLIDEVPVLAVAAAAAEGTTTFRDVGELRVKESDRIASVERMVRALGGTAASEAGTLTVTGGPLVGEGEVDTMGDHRIAMAAAVGALASRAGVRIPWGQVGTSYPGFLDDLRELRCG
jgi:3-phosphoshikimate 1-carboxyvinyltransferase